MIDGIANYGGDADVAERCHAATEAIDDAIDEQLRDDGQKDAHSLLAIMHQSGMPLDNVRANIKLTISGGQNEPRDAIAGSIWALLRHPRQLEAVRDGAVPWLDAFEEYCRWVAPIGMSPRRIAQAYEYEGVSFELGERIFLMFGSANRDEQHFDRPDEFDITRSTRSALTFGAGPHFCPGAAASRTLVGDVALPKIFDRLPRLAVDEQASPVAFAGWAFRGPLNLPATWTTT
jgi:cytochrome P450